MDGSWSELSLISNVIAHSPEILGNDPLLPTPTTGIMPRQADNDEQLVMLWLHGRSHHTQRAYRGDASRMLRFIGKPLHRVTLGDLQSFADDLDERSLKPRTKHRSLSAVKSLLSFAHKIGYLPFDTGKPLRLPTLRDELSERILDEGQVQRMIAMERHPRNHAILMLLYGSGVRVAAFFKISRSIRSSRFSARSRRFSVSRSACSRGSSVRFHVESVGCDTPARHWPC